MSEAAFVSEQEDLRRQLESPTTPPDADEDVQAPNAGSLISSTTRRPGTDQVRSGEVDSGQVTIPCANCEAVISDPQAVFCPRCGERVIDEETEVATRRMLEVLNANVPNVVRREIASLERKVIRLEQRVLEQGTRPFSWQQVPNDQKWSITWGVWGRQILVNIALFVGLMFVGFAIAGVIGSQ